MPEQTSGWGGHRDGNSTSLAAFYRYLQPGAFHMEVITIAPATVKTVVFAMVARRTRGEALQSKNEAFPAKWLAGHTLHNHLPRRSHLAFENLAHPPSYLGGS
ncbi:hypothetical protein B0T22DRAFT_485195 [Podospora appendiculata]|uniref:Uncharacterized protein n=1 Tax=Podospora appendiculata TaxID=314037 RepID=A0AAE0WZS2_9PEZI|nr:hypothetical protein B0T22DRAFT_485195 [Podospora appendiculata]